MDSEPEPSKPNKHIRILTIGVSVGIVVGIVIGIFATIGVYVVL